jgi:glycine/D-amino acid oxidase-like deaminating enzyme
VADAAIGAGASIYENTRVGRLDISGNRLVLEVGGRKICASHVILAINAWTATLLVDCPRIHSTLTYACATEPLNEQTLKALGLRARVPFYTVDTPYLWGRVSAAGNVVFGAGLSYAGPEVLERASIEAHDSRAILNRLERRVRRLHSELANVRIVARWAGPIAFVEGAVPLLGRAREHDGVLVAGAYAGHGVALSACAGELLARAILDNAPLPEWGALRRPEHHG